VDKAATGEEWGISVQFSLDGEDVRMDGHPEESITDKKSVYITVSHADLQINPSSMQHMD
jgi:hypothetical protein